MPTSCWWGSTPPTRRPSSRCSRSSTPTKVPMPPPAAIATGATGDQLWAAAWVYATSGIDSSVLVPVFSADDPSSRACWPRPARWRSARRAPGRCSSTCCSIRRISATRSPCHPVGDFAAYTLGRFVAGPDLTRRRRPTRWPAAWEQWWTRARNVAHVRSAPRACGAAHEAAHAAAWFAIGVSVVQGPLVGTITRGQPDSDCSRREVDHINHVITITVGVLTLYPTVRHCAAPRPRSAAQIGAPDADVAVHHPEAVRQQIQDQIEQVWSHGKKFECYDVVVKAIVTRRQLGLTVRHATSPDSVMIGLDQGATTFDVPRARRPLPSPVTRTTATVLEDRFVPVKLERPARRWAHPPSATTAKQSTSMPTSSAMSWAWTTATSTSAQHAGKQCRRQLRAGMADDLMNTSYNGNIDQSTIDRLIERSGKHHQGDRQVRLQDRPDDRVVPLHQRQVRYP